MSDSDDDLPLSEFIKKRKRLEIVKLNNEKNKQTKTENIIKKEKTTTTTTTNSSNNFNNNSKGNYINKAAEFYDSTKKGFILQKLLCRWWYAIDWPKLNDIAEAPVGYEGLDGFPGVFISTRVDSLGHILDLRNKETCPSYRNMMKLHTSKLKELCMKAYEKQIEILLEQEGSQLKLIRTLKSELREIKFIDPSVAETEAMKFKH